MKTTPAPSPAQSSAQCPTPGPEQAELSRRRWLQVAGLSAVQLAFLGHRTAHAHGPPGASAPSAGARPPAAAPGFGPLRSVPGAALDLPAGFTAVVLQRAVQHRLDDGRAVPGCFDGMACFAVGDEWVLLRNHELGDEKFLKDYGYFNSPKAYRWDGPADRPVNVAMHGGVSRVRLDPQAVRAALAGDAQARPVRGTRMAVTGTDSNCAGGRFAEGWVTCEETENPGHGYAYLVPPGEGATARRLDTWGRLYREAVALGADGNVYMTEDHKQGCLYRFRPKAPADPFGEGTLEVLVVPGLRDSHREGEAVLPADFKAAVRWAPVPDPQAVSTPCRAQVPEATRFYRVEGIAADGDGLWFTATQGGRIGRGQLFHLAPGRDAVPDTLRLALEVADPKVLSLPDNLALTPWGDLLLCEDNYSSDAVVTHQHLRMLTRAGHLVDLARNPQNRPSEPGGAPGGEFTGACFSPDGTVLFVNLQGDRDETLAITGPWPTRA